MNPKKTNKIDINALFEEEQTDFLPSLNDEIKNGMPADKMKVNNFEEVETQHGVALRIELTDMQTATDYSFLVSGKVFRKLFEGNVKANDIVRIYQNEKTHWRFEFVS